MAQVSRAAAVLIALATLLNGGAAWPQTPEHVLGTADGEYELFTPAQVVAAGGGSAGGNVPTPPTSGEFSLTSDDGTVGWNGAVLPKPPAEGFNTLGATGADIEWLTAADVLGRDLYAEFVGAGLPNAGDRIAIKAVDRTNQRITLKADPPTASFSSAVPKADSGEGAAGTALLASRGDHVHPASGSSGPALSDNVPKVERGDGAAGSGTKASRDDHVHPAASSGGGGAVRAIDFATGLTKPTTSNTYALFFDSGEQQQLQALRTSGYEVRATKTSLTGPSECTGTVPPTTDTTWAITLSGGCTWHATAMDVGAVSRGGNYKVVLIVPVLPTELSDNKPHAVGGGIPASAGAGTKASRDDHVHQVDGVPAPSTAVPSAIAAAGAAGTSAAFSRGDHVHPNNVPAPPNVANSDAYLRGRLGSYSFHTGSLPPLVTAANKGKCVTADQAGAALVYGDCDALPSISGNAKALLSVNAAASAVEWISPTTVILEGAGIQAADKGKLIAANSAGNGIALQTPHDAVLAGLPALTGHGGACLAVNTGATGLEFKSCGGGGGGGSLDLTALGSLITVNANTVDIASSHAACALFLNSANAGTVIAVELRRIAPDSTSQQPAFTRNLSFTRVQSPATNGFGVVGGFLFNNANQAAAAWGFEISTSSNPDKCIANGFNRPYTYYMQFYAVGAGGGGSSGPAIPAPTAAGKLKHLRVNAAGAAYELADPPPDLGDEVAVAEQAIEHLNAVTTDLIAGSPPAGWSNAASIAQGGVAVFNTYPDESDARGATYAVSLTSGVADKFFALRLPTATAQGQARIVIVGSGDSAGETFHQSATGLQRVGASADGTFTYYGGGELGDSVGSITVQLTSAAHVGSSRYAGLPTQVEPWAIKGSDLPVPTSSLPFETGWLKLYDGSFSGTGQIDIDLPNAAGPAIIAAQRDTEGAGVYRQFMVQFAWNIGTGEAEELVQTQALLPGVPLDGSVGQATQGLRYYGVLPGLDAVCPIFLKASTTAAALLGNGSCQPDWGNQGNAHPTVFWKLWGRR